MKAITLWQPHASWVAMKWKTIETRNHQRFKGLVGQRIAIHAAQKVDKDALFSEPCFLKRMDTRLAVDNFVRWMMICRGCVVCTAVVEEARWSPPTRLIDRPEWDRRAMCDTEDKFCIFLKDVQPFQHPLPYRGGRGIFNIPDKFLRIIHADPPRAVTDNSQVPGLGTRKTCKILESR